MFILSSLKNHPNFVIIVRVGHIGAVGYMRNGKRILEISREELWNDGVLNEDFDIEIINQMGCGEALEGVAVGADMYHIQKVRAFIGPYCNAELDAVAKMATFWNVPIIGYMASSNTFADKFIYKTLARVSLRTTNSLAEAVAAIINHYRWKKVGVATNTGSVAFERLQAFEEILHKWKIKINKKVMFEENMDATSMMQSGLLTELTNNARIIICIFSFTREMSKEFMKATYMNKMNNQDFVYILPWLQTESKDASPWIGEDGRIQQDIKDHYANSFIIDDVNGFDDTLVTPFRERIEANGMRVEDLDMKNIYGYIHLYDALRLYAIAVRTSINITNNHTIYEDGRFVWNQMRRLTFPGLASAAGVSSGTVMMDDIAERAPVYAAFYVSPKSDTVRKINEIKPLLIEQCDGLKTRTGCVELKITDIVTGFWMSPDGALPKDEPSCGFRNERCDYTMIIIAGALFLLLIFTIAGVLSTIRICENRSLAKMPWRIYRDDFRVIGEDEIRSMLSPPISCKIAAEPTFLQLSIGSTRTKLLNTTKSANHHAVLGTNTHAFFHVYPQRRPIAFNRSDMQLLTLMKQSIHDNINPFLGMSFNEKEEMVLLWKFCSRGTVQDIIYNTDLELDSKFHGAFIRDITLGLEYLHSCPIGYHGALTPWACLIDRNWMIKLTDFGIANSLERWEKQGLISTELLKDGDDEGKSGLHQKTSILYQPPEMLKNRATNRMRGTNEAWVKQTQIHRQMGDIYAFGVVMYEILFRSLPFPNGTNIDELLEYIRSGERIYRPSIQEHSEIHPDLSALLLDCWNEIPEIRPSIRRVRLNTESCLKVKGSLVDQMMRMMEQYANNLEKLVQERTGMLEDANERADRLLAQLLPKYVANELKLGRSVPPRTFQSATVMFSDIVGFTTICSSSTPLEVVNMLNGIYSKFDEVISKHKAYKVETIGDAYMVVSGIPEENGTKHIMHISDTALEIMELLKTFEIPHRRHTRLRIRLGYHCGSVAAGVVGLTAPRYCLFGDTVNMASRMESTGEPEKIQMSQNARDMLVEYYPEYLTELRGTVEVKGKGSCTTYWLLGKEENYNTNNEEVQQQQHTSFGYFGVQ
ncbi:adenylate/guanylate cyclase catalytic domain protein [Dictyocaulus viviparus]|uniref:Guanylate cyclase n=1 Tax=Dictyocaulus viviparus TaxID=29172 RepID=A0A0D8XMQ4_DICVI|nr:adenylate/guanylate cyclase catalytic domain protein [Dictyocaulus viviparus]